MALSLARRPPALSAERQAIATLIAERDDQRRQEDSFAAAKARADHAVLAARSEHELARRGQQAGVEGALTRLLAAEAALSTAQQARDRLESPTGSSAWSDSKVRSAALAVIAAEAGGHAKRLTQKVIELRRVLAQASHEWRWLSRHGALPVVEEHGDAFGRPCDPDARALSCRLDGTYLNRDDDLTAPELRADQPWAEAFEALQQDAATLLPVCA